MDFKNYRKIFERLPVQSKLLIYFASFLLLIEALLFFSFVYFGKYALPWIGAIVISFTILLAIIISKTWSKDFKKINAMIKNFNDVESSNLLEINLNDEHKQVFSNLSELHDSFKSDIDETISNENLAMMGEFATFIIHDLKNPVSGIHLLAEGLNNKIKENNELKKYSNEILFASQKLDDFIKRTLDITKSMVLHNQTININQLIRDVLAEINFAEIEVKTELSDTVPDIMGDYQLLYRAFTNIISNAVESIETDGLIFIKTKQEKKLVITISDNGDGIDDQKIKTIFRPFYSSKGHGHGLGLAMVKKTILMHKGTIEVESQKGVGSTFTIYLPLKNPNLRLTLNDSKKESD